MRFMPRALKRWSWRRWNVKTSAEHHAILWTCTVILWIARKPFFLQIAMISSTSFLHVPDFSICRNDRSGAALFPLDQQGPSVTLTCRWRTWPCEDQRASRVITVEFVARLHCLVQTEQVVLCGQLPKVWLSVCLSINAAWQCLLAHLANLADLWLQGIDLKR